MRSAGTRRRTAWIVAAAVVLVGVAAFAIDRARDADVAPRDVGGNGDRARGPASLLMLSVTGAPHPLMAVIGTPSDGRPAAFVPVPMDVTAIVPGQGEATATAMRRLSGPTVQVALSNTVGAWVEHFVVIDLAGLASTVENAGGLPAHLPSAYSTESGVLGPGDTTLSGEQTAALVAAKGDDASERWQVVLTALLADPPAMQEADVADTDDLAEAGATLAAASDATAVAMPTKVLGGTVTVVDQPGFDATMTETFGTSPPIPVIVQNGNGAPGVGEEVARRIIPAGFRVTLSQNAITFGLPTTDVIANGVENADVARKARRALGIGRVGVSQVPSGIGDITIVVGKDFTA